MNIIQNMDNTILKFIQIHIKNSIMDVIMPLLTELGSGITIWGIIGIILMGNKKYRVYGGMIVTSLFLCFIVGNLSLKPLIARQRPFEVVPLLDMLLIKQPKDFSFPSGHTMTSFASAIIILYMNKKIGFFALFFASIIGFTRLYLYVHYPSDVLVGMIIGMLIGIAVIRLFNNLSKKRKKIDEELKL